MPSSVPVDLRFLFSHIASAQPASVLDIGVGFGRWGFLCREFLDVYRGRYGKDKWATRIDGVEAYEPYITDHHRYIYDTIYIGDVREVLPTLGDYDLVIIGDMLEHLVKDEAWELFHAVMGKARKLFALNLPIGSAWPNQQDHENAFEEHRSIWRVEEFDEFYPIVQTTLFGEGRVHAAMIFSKADFEYWRLLSRAGDAIGAGRFQQAAELWIECVSTVPARPDAYMAYAEGLIRHGKKRDAERWLAKMSVACPDYYEGTFALASLQGRLSMTKEARKNLKNIIDRTGDGDEINTQARALLEQIRSIE